MEKKVYGQTDERAKTPLHGGDTGQGHETGTAGAEVLVQQGLSLSAEPSSAAGTSGYRVAEISDGHLCERMLLARARRLQVFCPAQDERRFLAKEDRAQQGARQTGAAATGGDGLALHHRMGVSVEAGCPSADAGILGFHALPDLSEGPFRPVLQAVGGGSVEGG